jgi:hypothetical protein
MRRETKMDNTKNKINKIPMIMKLNGKYQVYENGVPKENVSMKADYDGDDLEINIMDRMKNKESYLQLSNDQLFDLMSHKHTKQSLIQQLEDEIKISPIRQSKKQKKNSGEKNNKKNKKTRRKRGKKNSGKNKKQTRRKK